LGRIRGGGTIVTTPTNHHPSQSRCDPVPEMEKEKRERRKEILSLGIEVSVGGNAVD
jgi:hypothetical protein